MTAQLEDLAEDTGAAPLEAIATRSKGDKGPDAVELAGKFIGSHRYDRAARAPTLRRWQGSWYEWRRDRGCYVEVSAEQIEAALYRTLRLTKRSVVGDVSHALKAVDGVLIDEAKLPSWIGERSTLNPLDIATCTNGLLDLSTGTLHSATPHYFSTSALGVAFDPAAPEPARWNAFLRELWPDDQQSIELLQEWFGYLLTPDTRQQKIFFLKGARRSGKGTILRVINALLGGPDNVASPTLASLDETFGLQVLIGRNAATIGDARITSKSDIASVVERLLSISGEDSLTVGRKFLGAWTGKLSARFTISSNELPRLSDASGALASRMLLLELTTSFFGRENPHLTDELSSELPGILLWAIQGWQRLRQRGHFVQPDSSKHLVEDMENLGSPVKAWLRDRCRTGSDLSADTSKAYADFTCWCASAGQNRASMAMFGRDINACGFTKSRLRSDAGRLMVYKGFELLPGGSAL